MVGRYSRSEYGSMAVSLPTSMPRIEYGAKYSPLENTSPNTRRARQDGISVCRLVRWLRRVKRPWPHPSVELLRRYQPLKLNPL